MNKEKFKLMNALNNLDEKAEAYSEDIKDKKEQQRDYDLLFDFIDKQIDR